MADTKDILDALRDAGGTPKQNGSGWMANCPSHDDKHASLSISAGDDGRTLLKCHAGCATTAIVKALGLGMQDLFAERDTTSHIVATYPYCDEDGKTLFEVVRFTPKSFKQRRPDGNGGWHWDLNGVRRVLYKMGDVAESIATGHWIHVVEGERDADRLIALGVTATTCPGGAGKWREEFTEALV